MYKFEQMKEIYLDYEEQDDGTIISKEIEVIEYDVYFLLKDSKVIYIGCTSNIINRIRAHKNNRDFDSYFIYKTEFDKNKALQIESDCIRLLSSFSDNPLQNKASTNSIFDYREIIKF